MFVRVPSERLTAAMLFLTRRLVRDGASNTGRRQISTILSSSALSSTRRTRLSFLAGRSSLRYVHVRAISYYALPRLVARAFRVPIAGATVGAGAFGYANYRIDGVCVFFCVVTCD